MNPGAAVMSVPASQVYTSQETGSPTSMPSAETSLLTTPTLMSNRTLPGQVRVVRAYEPPEMCQQIVGTCGVPALYSQFTGRSSIPRPTAKCAPFYASPQGIRVRMKKLGSRRLLMPHWRNFGERGSSSFRVPVKSTGLRKFPFEERGRIRVQFVAAAFIWGFLVNLSVPSVVRPTGRVSEPLVVRPAATGCGTRLAPGPAHQTSGASVRAVRGGAGAHQPLGRIQ